jgi:hypothetical protein
MHDMWRRYRLRLDGLTKLCGSVPADPEIRKAWLEARMPRVRPPGGRSIDEINEEVFATLAEQETATAFDEEASAMLVFQRHEGGCVMRAATVKAHIKDMARKLSRLYIGKIKGESAFSTKLADAVYHDETQYWIPVLRPDGTPVTKHDGERDKPIHVYTPQGMRAAIKRHEWIEPWRLDVVLKVLGAAGSKRPVVSEEDLTRVFQYGATHGYAGERSDGEGRYTFTITHLEEG